jgi:hypothetical protein
MKTLNYLVLLFLLAAPAQAATGYLVPSNPPPVVQLTWDLVPGMTYNLYYGVGSGAYTNKMAVGATNYATVTLPSRGPTYFFAATAVASGLESDFSQEVNFRPAQPPSPPTNMRPPVVLSVQWKPAANDAEWADSGLNWGVWPEAPSGLFRLVLADGHRRETAAQAQREVQ